MGRADALKRAAVRMAIWRSLARSCRSIRTLSPALVFRSFVVTKTSSLRIVVSAERIIIVGRVGIPSFSMVSYRRLEKETVMEGIDAARNRMFESSKRKGN